MPGLAEPKASAFGLLAGSPRRLLAARRSFRFMSRQLVQFVKRRRTAYRIDQPRPADIGPIALAAKDNLPRFDGRRTPGTARLVFSLTPIRRRSEIGPGCVKAGNRENNSARPSPKRVFTRPGSKASVQRPQRCCDGAGCGDGGDCSGFTEFADFSDFGNFAGLTGGAGSVRGAVAASGGGGT